jgi:hypothetical protein
MKAILFFCYFIVSNFYIAQYVSLPQVPSPSLRAYMSALGSDSNAGDSLHPVASFSKALDILVTASNNMSGEVYAEVILFEGLYTQALSQNLNKFQLANRELNVGVRGRGTATLDGTLISNLSSGSGMVHLLGSGISVKNIHILYSPANGVRFGYNYNGTVINSQDIQIENVEVAATAGHGILVGIGALNTASPFTLTPMAERFLIQNCSVHDAVNYNTVQSQWGSAIKAWNARHVTIANCLVHDNGGEGIDFDECDSVDVYANETQDNVVGIYLDKVTNAWIHRNYISNTNKQSTAMLFGIEAYTSLITNHYIKNIKIFNNLMTNTQGMVFWQGIYGANQQGYFDQIEIVHNSIIGRQAGNGSCFHFNFETFLGQPAPNVHFSAINMHRNIIAAHPDSINNNQLVYATLPIPGFSASYNIYSQAIWQSMASSTDIIDATIPVSISNVASAIPGSGLIPMNLVPSSWLNSDFNLAQRFVPQTAAGAFEYALVGIHVNPDETFIAFPNPCFDEITFAGINHTYIQISDLKGKIVFEKYYLAGESLDIRNIDAGNYLIHTSDGRSIRLVKF